MHRAARASLPAAGLLTVFLLVAVALGVGDQQPVLALTSTLDVRDFGAVPNDGRDDRAAIQGALDAAAPGDVVHLPAGIYDLTKSSSAWSLRVDTSVRLAGDGPATILKALPGQGEWNHLVEVRADDVVVEDLTLDGNAANQPRYRPGTSTEIEQSHLLFVTKSRNVIARRLVLRESAGDGVYYHGGASGVVEDCQAYADDSFNPRVAFNFQGAHDAVFQRNYVQDYEVGFKAECDSSVNTERVRVLNNVARNTSMGIATNGIHDREVYARDIYVAGNDLDFTDERGFWIKDTIGLVVENNTFHQLSGGVAFYDRGHVEDVVLRDNIWEGAGTALSVWMYPYPGGRPSRNVTVQGNDFGSARTGVRLVHPQVIEGLDFSYNRLGDGATVVDNAGYALDTVTVAGNRLGGPPLDPPASTGTTLPPSTPDTAAPDTSTTEALPTTEAPATTTSLNPTSTTDAGGPETTAGTPNATTTTLSAPPASETPPPTTTPTSAAPTTAPPTTTAPSAAEPPSPDGEDVGDGPADDEGASPTTEVPGTPGEASDGEPEETDATGAAVERPGTLGPPQRAPGWSRDDFRGVGPMRHPFTSSARVPHWRWAVSSLGEPRLVAVELGGTEVELPARVLRLVCLRWLRTPPWQQVFGE